MSVYLWMIHDAVLQKLAQHFKAIVLQLKKKKSQLSQFLLFLGDGRWRDLHFAQHECLHIEMRRVFYQSLFSEML